MDMNAFYRYLCVFAVSAASVVASAQNLDPTVVVDRAYEGKLMEVHKPSLEMAVPDTVMRFDLDFDYSVFDNPYKGSYEFKPYLLSMKPDVASDGSGKFYLRAGAGYQLRPELDVVWSPVLSGKGTGLRLDVYARHRSYIGDYYLMTAGAPSEVDDTPYAVDRIWQERSGAFLSSRAGVSLGYDWKKTELEAGVGYYGKHRFLEKDFRRGYNAVDADLHLGSRSAVSQDGLVFDLDASYRYAADAAGSASDNGQLLNESNLEVGLELGTPKKAGNRFVLGLNLESDSYSGNVSGAASVASVTPSYVYEKGRLHADLGLKISKVITDTASSPFVFNAKEQILYPDVTVRFSMIREALLFYAKVGGGNRVYSNADLMEHNIWLYGNDMGIGVERISAKAGFEGRIGSRFSWNIHAGYADYASALVDIADPYAWTWTDSPSAVGYAPYRTWNGTFGWLWKSDRFTADGSLTYRNSWGDAFVLLPAFKPASVTGDVSFEYNYNRRIFAGVDCRFSSAREGNNDSLIYKGDPFIPGYADLGLSAEYVTSGGLSFWLRGGNLLGMTIQHTPLYAEKGPYFTLGICLNL